MTRSHRIRLLGVALGVSFIALATPGRSAETTDNLCNEWQDEVEGVLVTKHHFRNTGACYQVATAGSHFNENLSTPHYSNYDGTCSQAHAACPE